MSGAGAVTVLAAVLGLATIAVLWRLYAVARQGGTDPARGASILMLAGAVITAAGLVFVVADPWGSADLTASLALTGGPVVFLVGNLLCVRARTGRVSRSRVAAIGAFVVIACIGFVLPGVVLVALAFAVLLLSALVASGWFTPPSASVRE